MEITEEEFEKQLNEDYKKLLEQQEKIEEEENKINKSINRFTTLGWSFVIIGAVIFLFGIFVIIFKCAWREDINAFGSFVGGSVASFWSLAGLFFIFVAFLGQKLQLKLQQLEMKFSQYEVKSTRLELLGQKQQMIEQNKTLKRQRFENTFFQMVNLYSDILSSIDLVGENKTEGRDCFKTFYGRLKVSIERGETNNQRIASESADINDTLKGYNIFYTKNRNDIGHYFRTLYHIIKFIDNSDIEDKKRYIGLVRAQLSSHELALLFYNCLSDFGKEKFKPLIEEYAVLKNMDTDLVFNKEHIDLYAAKAYGQ